MYLLVNRPGDRYCYGMQRGTKIRSWMAAPVWKGFQSIPTMKVSGGQETGAIAPAPENARKKIWGVVDRARKKKKKN
jgi:hypothetical protein